ncbi:hypothetical protein QBC40DRAFT_318377 [Triangularia verruculosa]|uniref:NAD-dependent epimerase/dehydratase domain-containing protein n=1 Tax=Triangularia verruculosa TaxID=2587418 RepID=A0AAN7AQG8_9PEZI|nr:hypothetical protein QBC40DRAFT_318377 [Triangularia verruculosa]
MSTATKRLIVFGGNGFLGSRICRSAVSRNWEVISISRSGQPHWPSSPPSWSTSVTWQKGDIFLPQTYLPFLPGTTYLVHTLGILLEADYKNLLSGRVPLLSGLSQVFSSSPTPRRPSSPNPLDRKPGDETPFNTGKQLTYETMNRDSAILLAKEAEKAGVKGFGYISAAAGAPMLPSRYISTKREAEEVIQKEFPKLRGVFYRAPFMWDSSRVVSLPIAAGGLVASTVDGFTGGLLRGVLGSGAIKPLKVDLVADAVVEGLSDESVRGVVEPKEIERLGTKGWRRGML